MRKFFVLLGLAVCTVSFVCAGSEAQAGSKSSDGALPATGLGSYTRAHAMNPFPPDRLGGPIQIKVSVKKGSIRWNLPGPRQMDPAVFGTPAHPIGFEKTPFPLVGVKPGMRQITNANYSIVDHATPFSDWATVGVGDLEMTLTDATAIDGKTTKDKVQFEANFQAPDKSPSH